MYTWVLIYDFLTDRTSSILGVWAAPGGQETFQKGGGRRPPRFWKVFPAARDRPDPLNRRCAACQKITHTYTRTRSPSTSRASCGSECVAILAEGLCRAQPLICRGPVAAIKAAEPCIRSEFEHRFDRQCANRVFIPAAGSASCPATDNRKSMAGPDPSVGTILQAVTPHALRALQFNQYNSCKGPRPPRPLFTKELPMRELYSKPDSGAGARKIDAPPSPFLGSDRPDLVRFWGSGWRRVPWKPPQTAPRCLSPPKHKQKHRLPTNPTPTSSIPPRHEAAGHPAASHCDLHPARKGGVRTPAPRPSAAPL